MSNYNLILLQDGSVKLNARHAWASRLVDSLEVHFQSVNLLRKVTELSHAALAAFFYSMPFQLESFSPSLPMSNNKSRVENES